MHGSDDSVVPVEQSIAFDEALGDAGIDSTLIIVDGAGHGFPRDQLGPAKRFFDRILRSSPDTE
jgi:dipeptidyl aminopeptidase/acylaminoacyl peptidase